MLKEGVRLDRVRGGRQKYRRYAKTKQQHSFVIGYIQLIAVGIQLKPQVMEQVFLLSRSHLWRTTGCW